MDKITQAAKQLEDMGTNGISYTYVFDNETLVYMTVGVIVTVMAAMWFWKNI